MIVFKDITFLSVNAKLQADNKMLQLMSSTISHEMITPLSCMISITERMKKSSKKGSDNEYNLNIVVNTA